MNALVTVPGDIHGTFNNLSELFGIGGAFPNLLFITQNCYSSGCAQSLLSPPHHYRQNMHINQIFHLPEKSLICYLLEFPKLIISHCVVDNQSV